MSGITPTTETKKRRYLTRGSVIKKETHLAPNGDSPINAKKVRTSFDEAVETATPDLAEAPDSKLIKSLRSKIQRLQAKSLKESKQVKQLVAENKRLKTKSLAKSKQVKQLNTEISILKHHLNYNTRILSAFNAQHPLILNERDEAVKDLGATRRFINQQAEHINGLLGESVRLNNTIKALTSERDTLVKQLSGSKEEANRYNPGMDLEAFLSAPPPLPEPKAAPSNAHVLATAPSDILADDFAALDELLGLNT